MIPPWKNFICLIRISLNPSSLVACEAPKLEKEIYKQCPLSCKLVLLFYVQRIYSAERSPNSLHSFFFGSSWRVESHLLRQCFLFFSFCLPVHLRNIYRARALGCLNLCSGFWTVSVRGGILYQKCHTILYHYRFVLNFGNVTVLYELVIVPYRWCMVRYR